MIKLKCFTCKNFIHHAPGSAEDVINGGDDPYHYDYCAKYHFCDAGNMQSDKQKKLNIDPWINCPDYEEEPGKHYEGMKNEN
jgi:hypothetical protein